MVQLCCTIRKCDQEARSKMVELEGRSGPARGPAPICSAMAQMAMPECKEILASRRSRSCVAHSLSRERQSSTYAWAFRFLQ